MIYTNIAHCLDYLGINENLDKALHFLAETDMNALSDDNHLICGQDVRVKVQHMSTKLPEAAKPEAHNDFADIQLLMEGEETLLCCFRDENAKLTEAHPDRDLYFYEGKTAPIALKPGELLIVFPDDIHAPGVCTTKPMEIRKAVFKVKLES